MRDWLFPLILLIFIGWTFTATAQGAADLAPAETPVLTSTPTSDPIQSPKVPPSVTITPTIDRLAAPPTAENPTQADEGAQLFWLHCQPCHGDVGQGLTEEWRQQYPPEDQDCWTSGCHGKRPYENGFTLPTAVPAVTGEDSLERFETIGQLYGFISSAMPYQDPGYLTEEEYLAMTAFLARAHGVWDGTPLDTENVGSIRLRPSAAAETSEPTPSPSSNGDGDSQDDIGSFSMFIIGIAVGLIGCLGIIAVLIKRRM